jgi:7-cyano-7-deazaguanine reductase
MSDSDASGLTLLGSSARGPVDHVEFFPAPPTVTKVRFSTDEVTSLCPVTGQPDISSVVIEYEPDRLCIESKSLKLYLWSFRDRAVFAEALAAEIAAEVQRSTRPRAVCVVVTQHARGGIVIQATAELPGTA